MQKIIILTSSIFALSCFMPHVTQAKIPFLSDIMSVFSKKSDSSADDISKTEEQNVIWDSKIATTGEWIAASGVEETSLVSVMNKENGKSITVELRSLTSAEAKGISPDTALISAKVAEMLAIPENNMTKVAITTLMEKPATSDGDVASEVETRSAIIDDSAMHPSQNDYPPLKPHMDEKNEKDHKNRQHPLIMISVFKSEEQAKKLSSDLMRHKIKTEIRLERSYDPKLWALVAIGGKEELAKLKTLGYRNAYIMKVVR